MRGINKYYHQVVIRTQILKEFLQTLWKYKLWWGMPIIFIILALLILLFVAGSTGVAAFIYPLF
jgi:hypothetical protein